VGRACAAGDPTLFGNFKAPATGTVGITEALANFRWNGYPPAHGYEAARAAVARTYTRPTAPLTAEDVVIASGCSGALELAITAIANEGQNILVPRPGFSLYQVIADAYGIETRHYDLLVRVTCGRDRASGAAG
jgi:tyrosine aminotransferase